MKKLILLLLFIPLVFSCSSDDDDTRDLQLTIVNNFELWEITNISLQDYEFVNLSINGGSSRTFILNEGIPSGSSDIGVSIIYTCHNRSDGNASTRVDFSSGYTTIAINPTPDDSVDANLQDCFNYEFIVSN
jgi:hypothetical protein|tara:strand:+ start:572 stop:967 length:396 start_codon:yes stop_codon:yes gene_type:complete